MGHRKYIEVMVSQRKGNVTPEKTWREPRKCGEKVGNGNLRCRGKEKQEKIHIAIKEEKPSQCPLSKKVIFLLFFQPSWAHSY